MNLLIITKKDKGTGNLSTIKIVDKLPVPNVFFLFVIIAIIVIIVT